MKPNDLSKNKTFEIKNLFAGSNARILLAEDNIINQKVALGILKKMGLTADAVADGKEALKMLESVAYDLILMDVQMPEMDGYETTHHIRSSQLAILNPAIPVIAMTANAMTGDREKCLKAGMNGYVAKPVDPLSLARELEKWLATESSPSSVIGKDADDLPEPVFSADIFNREEFVERMLGDEELADKIIAGFLADMPLQIKHLKAFVDQGMTDQAGAQAHKIKGAAGNVSAVIFQDIAYVMEKAGKSGNMNVLKKQLSLLEKSFSELQTAMEIEK